MQQEATFYLNQILEKSTEAFVMVDKEGVVLFLSQAYADFLDVDRDWAVGKHITQVIENTRMHLVLKTGIAELNSVQNIKGQQMLANRIPIRYKGEIIGAYGRVLFQDVKEMEALLKEIQSMKSELNLYKGEFERNLPPLHSLDSIISRSAAMEEVKRQAFRYASTDTTILLLGESGTGKDLLASAIHQLSPRREGRFLKINCSNIPETLMESELFGYVDGSFTGATRGGKIGKFEAAEGGTIFLDEIGELPLSTQAKLLRVLQEKVVEPLGSNDTINVDVRIIAATNQDLEKMVEAKKFRLDLFYRLNVLTIHLPPLRERHGDMVFLCRGLLDKISKRMDRGRVELSKQALHQLTSYQYPGNIRELENILEYAMMNMESGENLICPEHLPVRVTGYKKRVEAVQLSEILEAVEKETILHAMELYRGNKSKVAQQLGISRTTLYTKLKEHNLQL